MTTADKSKQQSYDDFCKDFSSPLMEQVSREAYGKNIGQHSWVTAEDLDKDSARLQLSTSSRLLDLGCGPGGPLTYVVGLVGCHGIGTDASGAAIAAAQARASALGLNELCSFQTTDSNQPMPFATRSFDAVMSLDVILHLRDRVDVFREVVRVLTPGGRFLFTDSGVITGSVSNEEIRSRAAHGYTQFVPPGFNERAIERAGMRVREVENRSEGLLKNAAGRVSARLAHEADLRRMEGDSNFELHRQYLESLIRLFQTEAMSRYVYLAESPGL